MIETEGVPVIDMASLNDAASRAAIDRACRQWGFFQVVGHDVEPTLTDGILAVAREFFAQPSVAKRAILRDADNPWGYDDKELTKNRQDCKEIFDFGPADGRLMKPRWPSGPLRLRFEPMVRAYYASCKALALRLLATIASNLSVDAASLTGHFDGAHTSFLRLNHDPPHPAARSGARKQPLGVGGHTDSGALTVLLQDDQSGLQVRRDGRWHGVQPIDGALVINVGDMVQVWSNDDYQAATRRVTTHAARDRYSVPFFLNPSDETVCEPLSAVVSVDRPARYRPIRWREFRAQRAAGDPADPGQEIQTDAPYRAFDAAFRQPLTVGRPIDQRPCETMPPIE